MTNPGGASVQVLGVYEPSLTDKMALVLKQLGTKELNVDKFPGAAGSGMIYATLIVALTPAIDVIRDACATGVVFLTLQKIQTTGHGWKA